MIRELVRDKSFEPIVTIGRKSQPELVQLAREAGVELREVIEPTLDPAVLEQATREATNRDAVGFSVLGIGAGTGKLTIAQHRAVDVELNAAFARGLKASGRVTHLAFMSAIGANPAASETGSGTAGGARYARVKGESEEAVKASGLVVSIFRPGMIIGSQHTPWILEKALPLFGFLTPGKYKSITVDQIAKAMVATAKQPPAATGVYHYPEMKALGSGA